MRALPASQSCHVRNVDEMSAAAADWERPAASRAPRISEGDGLGIADGGYVGDKLRMCGIVRNSKNYFPKFKMREFSKMNSY